VYRMGLYQQRLDLSILLPESVEKHRRDNKKDLPWRKDTGGTAYPATNKRASGEKNRMLVCIYFYALNKLGGWRDDE